ncbi:MAG: tetratricopeptide repeat protein [Bacteroidota bacterium]|nr:tetratricopeptide repeat protein [Bacteroidota bacterium]
MKKLFKMSLMGMLLCLSFMAFQCSSTEMTSAKLYIQQKNYAKAKEALMKEIQKNPNSDEGYYMLGYLYGEEGDFAKMADNYNKSLSISKKFAKNIEDSRKYYWMNAFNKGVNYFNKATKAKAEDSVKTFYTQAIKAFKEAIAVEPDSADTYKNLAFASIQAGRQDDAIEPLENLLKIKKSADGYKILGQIYNTKGSSLMTSYKSSNPKIPEDSVKAMDYYNKAIVALEDGRKAFPDDPDILLHLSNALISANKLDVAMETFKAGVEKDPKNQFYRYNYGTLLLQAGKYEEAIDQFTKAIEIDPKYHSAVFNLAVAYVKWGTSLREAADKAGKDDPEYKNKYKDALPWLKKAVEIKPDDALSWDTLAKVYAVLGMNKESQDAYTQADKLRK